MTQSNTSSPQESEVPFESQGVMTVKNPPNEKISGEGKNGGRERVVLLFVEEERIGEHKYWKKKTRRSCVVRC